MTPPSHPGRPRNSWASWDADAPTTLSDEELLALVQGNARRLDRRLLRRDWGEVIAGAIAAALIAPAAFHGPLVARCGALTIVAGMLLIAVRLTRARRVGRGSTQTGRTRAVAEALHDELRHIDAQIALLRSVLWWYVGPIAVGAVMLVAGSLGASWLTLAYTIAVALLAWGIVGLNARAIRRGLLPKREELVELLAQFEPPRDH